MHAWDLSPSEAVALQRRLASQVVRDGDLDEDVVRFVAGGDVAFDKPNGRGVGAVVVLSWPECEVVERATVEQPVTFPYVPGLLSFRETPVLLPAFQRLSRAPDLLLVDGHGYAHPRRFGFASHVGLLLDVPSIGVAKSRLVGEPGVVAGPRGARADVVDEGEVVGSMLRTKQGARSVYVSVGHRISLSAAERWVLGCARGYRVPEPTRMADRQAGEAKRRMLDLTLEMVIEQRAGEHGRWEWEEERDEVVFRHELDPMPTHYGCSSELINEADEELLDIMLVDAGDYSRGERTTVRAVDVLIRGDGDHKLLAVPAATPMPLEGAAARAVVEAREASWRWYVAHAKPVTAWGGEDIALATIRRCRGRSVDISSSGADVSF
jgi:deoxyribonuclease V